LEFTFEIKEVYVFMKIIIIGCGRVGIELAQRLYLNRHEVTIVDNNPITFTDLPESFHGRTIEGDALNQDILRRAGIESADGLAAVTSSDSINAVVAHIAHQVYEIPNVVVRNFDSRYRLLHESFNLQLISSSSWGAQRIEELLYHKEGHAVHSAGNGEVELYEFTIPEAWSGKTLSELLPQDGCIAAAITRAGRAMLPLADTQLEEGDIFLVSATLEGSTMLRERIQPGSGNGRSQQTKR
jgi:trk system potassium uptake protein TrkA